MLRHPLCRNAIKGKDMSNKFYLSAVPFILLSFATGLQVNAQNTARPNVIFIICDDLNDYQGVFGGHPQALTPNIDRLAQSGVQFVNAQSNAPVCAPSRNSLITGVYPHHSRDYGWTLIDKQPVLKNNKTLIGLFRENGYSTLGTGKIIHGGKPHMIKDFDVWGNKLQHNYGPLYYNGEETEAHPTVPAPYSAIGPIDGSFGRLSDGGESSGKSGEKGWVYGWDKQPMRYVSDDDRDMLQDELHARWAMRQLDSLEGSGSEKPFFMAIGFVRPHTPLHAPDRYFDLFPLEDLELDAWMSGDAEDTHWSGNFIDDQKGPKYYRTLLQSYNGDRELAIKHFLQAYLACVAFVDEQVGKVIDALEDSAYRDNTIVVFTSDHGWQMGEKNYLFKNSPWEESARVPMVIRAPGAKAGARVDQPVSLIDLFPTLTDLCRLEGDHRLNPDAGPIGGFSMRPLLYGKGRWKGPRGALTIVGNYGLEVATDKQNFSYRTKRWRYIRYGDGQEELYDHTKDPNEWENLAGDRGFSRTKNRLKEEIFHIINQ